MTHRERLLAALSHKQPDRVPVDIGSTIVTGISLKTYAGVKQILGIETGPTRVFDQAAQLAQIDEEVLTRWGVDTRGFIPGSNPDLPNDVDENETITDDWGIRKQYSPESETFFVADSPLKGEISVNRIRAYPWPDPHSIVPLDGLLERIREAKSRDDYAIVLALPTNFILTSMELRGFEDWYMDFGWNKTCLGFLFDQILEIQLEICDRILSAVGDQVDVVVNFDDLAMQDRLLVSPASFKELLKPRLKRLFDFIHSKTPAKLLHHSDGAIQPILDDLIEIGVDAINPVQVSARGMGDLPLLKRKFGDRITFWGGIDTQHLLPFATPQEVYSQVQRTIEEMNVDGGYVLCSVHNIQNDVPPENVVAMFDAILEYQQQTQ